MVKLSGVAIAEAPLSNSIDGRGPTHCRHSCPRPTGRQLETRLPLIVTFSNLMSMTLLYRLIGIEMWVNLLSRTSNPRMGSSASPLNHN